jgi:D-beta-D-heptose 7-phosphate kinase/D-beta-D-heptose 1-phosphate adenosyltransferase
MFKLKKGIRMPAKIYNDITEVTSWLTRTPDRDVYVTSGGFDPMHVGHLRCIQETVNMANDIQKYPTKNRGIVVVIVNGDGFLLRKKGYSFMPHEERMEIIAGIEGVDYVVGWEDESQTVTGAISILQPNYFTKGGDRGNPEVVPEFKLCKEIGCEVIFNVGGEKIQSSSSLVATANKSTG